MVDERVGKLARLLVDYSIQAGEGDQVLVSGEVGAGPLISALYARLLQVGATPVTQISLPGMQEIFFEHAQELHYQEIPKVTRDPQAPPAAPSIDQLVAPVSAPAQGYVPTSQGPVSYRVPVVTSSYVTRPQPKPASTQTDANLPTYEDASGVALPAISVPDTTPLPMPPAPPAVRPCRTATTRPVTRRPVVGKIGWSTGL